MLNETFALSRSMQAAGIAAESWHKDYGTCPKYRTFRLLLDSRGNVVDLESIASNEQIVALRKWEVSNGTSFPAFNVLPLLQAKTQDAKDDLSALKKEIKSGVAVDKASATAGIARLWKSCHSLWGESEIGRINRCLQSHPKSLQSILREVPKDLVAITELIRRAAMLDAQRLETDIRAIVMRRVVQSPNDAKEWIDTLLVSSAKSPKKVSLVLELSDWSSQHFDYPANHANVQRWINSRLMARGIDNSTAGAVPTLDAFGQPLSASDSALKFPSVSLPKLGGVNLRAMSGESPCQARYGRTDSESFPAGTVIRQAMKDSLEWLGDPSRKGRTWEDLSGACGFTKREGRTVPIAGVLLAYPSILPADPPELAGALGGEGQPSDPEGVKFEMCAKRVTAALNLAVKKHPATEIRVFVLAKADKARTKLLVSRRYEAKQIVSAAQSWLQGCRDIPDIRLNIGTNDKPNWRTPYVPFPTEVVRCLNVAWLRGGTTTDTVHGLNIGEGLSLFMETDVAASRTIERSLRLAVSNTCPLLLAIGHADHRRDGTFSLTAYPEYASLLPSLLGLLLHKLGYTKGGYMRSAPFLVGQMLALSDTLHKEYCQHVRKGETPLQLVGNALMPTALDNPTAGVARLSERIVPYQAWANTVGGDDAGLAKWTLQRFREIADQLGNQALPESCNDSDKAQMLLGYLARIEANTPDSDAN